MNKYLFLLVALAACLWSCGGGDASNTGQDHSHDHSDHSDHDHDGDGKPDHTAAEHDEAAAFSAFWGKFQAAVAAGDEAGLQAMGASDASIFADEETKTIIAGMDASGVAKQDDGSYVANIVYQVEDGEGSSTTIIFVKEGDSFKISMQESVG